MAPWAGTTVRTRGSRDQRCKGPFGCERLGVDYHRCLQRAGHGWRRGEQKVDDDRAGIEAALVGRAEY
jgi:hypothetical protein